MDTYAYRSLDDYRQSRSPITSEDSAHLVEHYIVNYKVKTLIGPDRYSDTTLVQISLLANGNYPFTEPACWVISGNMPWSAHFKVGTPICIGEIWQDARGNILLGHLLIHIAKLLNFDEITRGGGYKGYNSAAIDYWKNKLNWRPITPNLVYPNLPTEITHDLGQRGGTSSVFQPRHGQNIVGSNPSVFKPTPDTKTSKPSPPGFRPKPKN